MNHIEQVKSYRYHLNLNDKTLKITAATNLMLYANYSYSFKQPRNKTQNPLGGSAFYLYQSVLIEKTVLFSEAMVNGVPIVL